MRRFNSRKRPFFVLQRTNATEYWKCTVLTSNDRGWVFIEGWGRTPQCVLIWRQCSNTKQLSFHWISPPFQHAFRLFERVFLSTKPMYKNSSAVRKQILHWFMRSRKKVLFAPVIKAIMNDNTTCETPGCVLYQCIIFFLQNFIH